MNNKRLTREIRKAMIAADVDFKHIGYGAESTWYRRIDTVPEQMTLKVFCYLCNRLNVKPSEIIKVLEE